MKHRFGIKPAPEGCGAPDQGPCFACSVRALRRKGAWSIRQLLPLKYSTHYFTGGDTISAEPDTRGQVIETHPTYVNLSTWRMWMGRVFAHEALRWEIATPA